jgi:hypothetical protein
MKHPRRLVLAAVLLGAALTPVLGASAAAPAPLFKITPTAFDFGYVPMGSTTGQQIVTVINKSSSPQVMNGAGGGAGVFGGSQDCQGTTLAPGAVCHMYYAFSPTALGATTGSTNGTWNGQAFSFSFKGYGLPHFRISPTTFDFGPTALGSSAPQQTVTVTNLANKSVVMNGAGGGAGLFGGSQDCQGTTLGAGSSCHMYYQFTPTAVGAATGSTNGNWNGQNFSFSFSGFGTPRFTISPTSFDFGQVKVGTTGTVQTVTVTNRGSTPVVMNGAGGGAGQFGGSQDCQGTTVQPGKTCHMYYAFSPSTTGTVTGSTNGTWNGQSFAFNFTGTGIA